MKYCIVRHFIRVYTICFYSLYSVLKKAKLVPDPNAPLGAFRYGTILFAHVFLVWVIWYNSGVQIVRLAPKSNALTPTLWNRWMYMYLWAFWFGTILFGNISSSIAQIVKLAPKFQLLHCGLSLYEHRGPGRGNDPVSHIPLIILNNIPKIHIANTPKFRKHSIPISLKLIQVSRIPLNIYKKISRIPLFFGQYSCIPKNPSRASALWNLMG